MPGYAVNCMKQWTHDVISNAWLTVKDLPEATEYIFSDASSTGKAFIKIVDDVLVHGEYEPRTDALPIFMGEAMALLAAIPHVDKARTLFGVDNQTLHYVLRKGHSSSYRANCMLRDCLGSFRPQSTWIPTHLMPADRYTRGVPATGWPRPLDAQERAAIDLVRSNLVDANGAPTSKRTQVIPHFRPSVDDATDDFTPVRD